MRIHGPQVLRYLRTLARNEEDANEMFSIFSEHLWKGLPAFRRECAVGTWAHKLAWHAATRFFQDPYRKRARALASVEYSRMAQAVRTTTALHLRTAVKDKMARLRGSLDPAEQTLLALRIDQGMTFEDIAEVMSAEAPALRKRFERLKDKLRKLACDQGLIPR